MNKVICLIISVLIMIAYPICAATEYEIEVSHKDEFFIINDEKFEAKTYCFDMKKGDRVIFLEGSSNGACVSAIIRNLRTKKDCKVWCER